MSRSADLSRACRQTLGGDQATLASPGSRLTENRRGQALVEAVFMVPLLLIILLGVVEAARAYDLAHTLSGLGREGANIVSRGEEPDSVVQVILTNGTDIGLPDRGGTVVSRVRVESGVPRVKLKVGSPGYLPKSAIGEPGERAAVVDSLGLREGQTVHVVELFYELGEFTPFSSLLFKMIPDLLYDRTVF